MRRRTYSVNYNILFKIDIIYLYNLLSYRVL